MANDPQDLRTARPFSDERVRYTLPTPSDENPIFLVEMSFGSNVYPVARTVVPIVGQCHLLSVVTPPELPVPGYPDNFAGSFLPSARSSFGSGVGTGDEETVFDICDPTNMTFAFGGADVDGSSSVRRGDRLWCSWNPRHNWMQPMGPYQTVQKIEVLEAAGEYGGVHQCNVEILDSSVGLSLSGHEVSGYYRPAAPFPETYPWFGMGTLINGWDVPMWIVFCTLPYPRHTHGFGNDADWDDW